MPPHDNLRRLQQDRLDLSRRRSVRSSPPAQALTIFTLIPLLCCSRPISPGTAHGRHLVRAGPEPRGAEEAHLDQDGLQPVSVPGSGMRTMLASEADREHFWQDLHEEARSGAGPDGPADHQKDRSDDGGSRESEHDSLSTRSHRTGTDDFWYRSATRSTRGSSTSSSTTPALAFVPSRSCPLTRSRCTGMPSFGASRASSIRKASE